ncbi:hypothetical protein ACFCP7_09495 [Paenibacillus elgii]
MVFRRRRGQDGRIAAVGRVEQEARSVVDAHRQVIAPGFIDGHCHSDLMIFDHPHSEIKIRQGVTTEVVGNCGLAPAPFVKERAELLQSYVQPVLGKRGLIVPGYAADLTVFNPDTIQDLATFEEPRQYPNGISHVIVAGKTTLTGDQHTHAREGGLIRASSCCAH